MEKIKQGLWVKYFDQKKVLCGSIKASELKEMAETGKDFYINIYSTDNKTNDKYPDASIYFKPKEEKSEQPKEAPKFEQVNDEDIPF